MTDFTAVVTTGIYCRAGCPATPLRRNTRPFSYAAAAEAAGFRPCLRCRPDREPEPAWVDAPELVCRSLRSIADGALDDATEDELAARARRERAPPPPALRSTRRRDAGRSRSVAARPLRSPAARRHGSVDCARERRRRVQQRAPDEPGDERGVPLHAAGAARPKRRVPDRCVTDGGLETAHSVSAAARVGRAPRVPRAPRHSGRRGGRSRCGGLPPHGRARRRARRDRGVERTRARFTARPVSPSRDRRARAPDRGHSARSSTSTPTRTSSTGRSRRDPVLLPLVRARPGIRLRGHDRPVRDRRPRGARPAGLRRGCDPARGTRRRTLRASRSGHRRARASHTCFPRRPRSQTPI